MTKEFPRKKILFKLSVVLLTCLMLFVIHSCKKNFTGNGAETQITDPEVSAAKSWYNEAYPVNKIDKSGLQTNSVQEVDVSQKIKPDWQRPSHYKRFNNDVIEIPLDPSAKFNAVLKNTDYNKELNTPEQSRSSFLMLKNNGKYEAYIMTIIGDADYLKGDVSKLARNTYSKRDTNFSGLVFYFTPKGRYLSGYRYKNGHQLKPQQAQSPQVQNVKLKTNNNLHVDCYDVINTITTNGVITAQYVAFSFCTVAYSDETPPPSSGGGSSGGGGSTPVPPQCPPGTVVNSIHLQVNGNAPPGEEPIDPNNPGFPPPTPSSQQCTIITQPTAKVDSLSDENLETLIECDSLQLLQLAAYNNFGNMYQNVASFHPSQSVMNRISSLQTISTELQSIDPFVLQNLDNAFGTVVNSDFFPIQITSMPTGMNMATLTEYFRQNINNFTSGKATFSPYVGFGVNETQLFNQYGAGSLGAVVHIDMADDGTVIESDYQSNNYGTYFKFSTMTSPFDFNHPVSGNREFGIYPDSNNPGTYTFYTMGVDRTSDWMFAFANNFNAVFNGADQLWTAMQTNMINYINTHGGQASFYNKKNYVARPNYNLVRDYLNKKMTLAQLKSLIGC
ncbi:hypothetical protein [Mucilaginibacter sp. UYCu711]|uniref:hypothetical protein n=1 Tax=Mucilaginibacter sp. UYCu711 TaxID=3156339 RepID=UPI003D203C52